MTSDWWWSLLFNKPDTLPLVPPRVLSVEIHLKCHSVLWPPLCHLSCLKSFLWSYLFIPSVTSCLESVQLFVTPWTVDYQAPLSVGFSRQEYWSGLPFSSPGDLPNPGISHIVGRHFTIWATMEAINHITVGLIGFTMFNPVQLNIELLNTYFYPHEKNCGAVLFKKEMAEEGGVVSLSGRLQLTPNSGGEELSWQQTPPSKFRSNFSLPGKLVRMDQAFRVITEFGEHS